MPNPISTTDSLSIEQLQKRSDQLAAIEKALTQLLWIDDNGTPLTGEKLVNEVIDNGCDYKTLQDTLMDIQNIMYKAN